MARGEYSANMQYTLVVAFMTADWTDAPAIAVFLFLKRVHGTL